MRDQRRLQKQGFTIIEAAIGVTIAALIASISFNQFLSQRPTMALTDVAWDMMSELRLARATAITENTRAIVTFSDIGMTVEADSSGDGIVTDDERRLVSFSNNAVKITRSQSAPVAFTGSGRFIINNATATLAFETITLQHTESRARRIITIYSNGQVNMEKE